ncbi:MAG: EscN/YscN/HrcN family type III secretion system ATPase [Phycisphaerales bacterium]|nr:EscN/YscN/HrcN family type III secretion system ATPase [Phycisphaerales bacterium]
MTSAPAAAIVEETYFASALRTLEDFQPLRVAGVVSALRGLTVMVDDLPVPAGSLVSIHTRAGGSPGAIVLGEVIGFTKDHAVVMTLGDTAGIRPGDHVVGEQVSQTTPVGERMLGRCVDGLGRPIDGKGPIHERIPMPLTPRPIQPLARRRITQPLHTGVRAVDLFTTLGSGQRMGIFAGPGVGKSTLLGTIAARSDADVNVIALIGERGREVKDFIEHSLGPQGLTRSVVFVATGDESPLMRVRAAKAACSQAEYFRSRGKRVMLMMDSVTRFAHAQRQIGLSVGEPPATKGYTPSVFAQMALLLERAGAVEVQAPAPADPASPGATPAPPSGGGSITGLYTILVEGDDMTEPVADAARGILDGHLVLSRSLAQKAHFPAIDVLDSVSRVADEVCEARHLDARRQAVRLLALYKEVEDLVQIGAYARGARPETDIAIDLHDDLIRLLRQSRTDCTPFAQGLGELVKISQRSAELLARSQKNQRPAAPRRTEK